MREVVQHIAENAHPLVPIPTGLSPRLDPVAGIEAVAFDIYGTLFISGSGDIGVTDAEQESGLLKPILAGLCARKVSDQPACRFRELIQESHHRSRAAGTDFPEVDILEIWQALVEESEAPPPNREALQQAATAYEVATNPVWPMPGARETLATIRESGRPLGIVSNAQFYTPLLFEAFWQTPVTKLGFDPDLCFYSYQSKQAKPGTALYENLRDALENFGISAAQTLYVGNDMLKDIKPATAVGFRTALFAGDQRSLRLRRDCKDLPEPDAVITQLPQLLDIIS